MKLITVSLCIGLFQLFNLLILVYQNATEFLIVERKQACLCFLLFWSAEEHNLRVSLISFPLWAQEFTEFFSSSSFYFLGFYLFFDTFGRYWYTSWISLYLKGRICVYVGAHDAVCTVYMINIFFGLDWNWVNLFSHLLILHDYI